MSKTNATCVNGLPVDESVLAVGDVVEFAGHRLIADFLPNGRRQDEEPELPTSRVAITPPSQRLRLSQLNSVEGHHACDLLSLFQFSRRISTIFTVGGLADALRTHVIKSLTCEKTWLAWPYYPDENLVLFPATVPGSLSTGQQNVFRRAALHKCGLVESSGEKTLAVVPLVQDHEVIGIFGALLDTNPDINHQQLDYLVALADCVAPQIWAAERLQHFRRDSYSPSENSLAETRIIGPSVALSLLRERLQTAASSNSHILLLGETGTGKDLTARLIHELGTRSNGPYVPVNCAAIPAELFDTEMFGYEKGAFTGAGQPSKGLFEEAHGGTLFLDEIGELSKTSQARLLRAADLGRIRPIGAVAEIQVDVRIVSATNRLLPDPSSRDFRMDLFHRLAGFVIQLTPLRERREDIPELALHFLQQCSPNTTAKPASFSTKAMEQLMEYDWPGNVRELRNVVERACYLAKGRRVERVEPLVATVSVDSPQSQAILSLEEVELAHLNRILRQYSGNVSAAAKGLGIPRSTLYYKLSRHGLSGRNAK